MKQDVLEPGVIYHIFNRGNNQENIYRQEKNYSYFLNLMEKHLLPVADIFAYCLLANHFHLAIRIKDINELPEKLKTKPYLAFSNLFNAYTKGINKMYDRQGSLFQEHLHRNRVEDENYLTQLIAYIHLNPSKHKFCDNYKLYRYSSYNAYMSDKPSHIERVYILKLFGDKSNFEYWHDQNKIVLENKMLDI